MYTPTLLSWDESLTTGDRDLDTQHKYLIEICNDLAYAIEKKRGAKIIDMVIKVLTFYVDSHFKKEEECMARYHCVVGARNQKAHAAFIKKLKSFQEMHNASEAPDELAIQIHQFLTDWIISHIKHIDTYLYSSIHHTPGPNNETHPPIR